MGNSPAVVDDDVVVSLEYILKLDDGEEVDRSDSGSPLQFVQGHGQVISGLEDALYGMVIGEVRDVVVEPEDGYGHYDSENVVAVSRESFPDELELEEGMQIYVRDSETGTSHEATVSEVLEETVVLDFNHPLAGETLHFRVKVNGLREATAEELEHGHVHDGSEDHNHST
jgi:FKBP-type peptidyl-prolyl cis-trans isomerase SlyD